MNKNLSITLKVDAKTGAVTSVRNSFDELDQKVSKTQDTLAQAQNKLIQFASAGALIYGIGKAFNFVMASGLDYNKSMDASTAKLTAMISASRAYITVGGEHVSAMERQKLIAQETAGMMQILKTTNAQTAMGMSELIDVYSLAKPGMDKYKWAVADQIEIVKLAANTASTFGMTAEELSTGIDDLAAGTWEASSGFGKMMKTLGVSRTEYKATADKVAYLKEKMRETGEAQDTWAVATSNFSVAWDTMAGQITQPIFDSLKESIKLVTKQLGEQAPESMQVFSDGLVDLANAGIQTIAVLIQSINMLISSFQLAYAGYQKVAGLVGGAVTSSALAQRKEDLKELQRIQKEGDYGWFSDQTASIVAKNIKKQKAAIASITQDQKYFNETRRNGDKNAEDALKRGVALHELINTTVAKIKIKKGGLSPIAEAIEPAKKLAFKLNNVTGAIDKKTKADKKAKVATQAHTKALKTAQKEAERYADELQKAQRTLEEARLFNIGGDSLVQMSKLGDELASLGEYLSQAELAEVYQSEIDKMSDSTDTLHDKIKDLFNIDSDSMFGKLFDDFDGLFDGFVNVLKSDKGINGALADMNLGVQGANMLQKSGDATMAGIGYALEAVGALLSNTLSEAEIKRATGRSEFDSKSLSNQTALYENYQSPQLTVARQQLERLQSLNDKFGAVAVAMSGTNGGIALDGSNFNPTQSAGFLGFSSSSTQLLGAGLDVAEQTVGAIKNGFEVVGYESIKKTSSKFWGLVTNERLVENSIELSDKIKGDLSTIIQDSFDLVSANLEVLGFDVEAFNAALENEVIKIGKINFKDMNAEEKQIALQGAISEMIDGATSGALGSIASSPNMLASLESMQRVGEEFTTTIARVAIGYETVTTQLALFGQSVDSFAQSQTLIDAAGGLDVFNSSMQKFISSFYTTDEQHEMQELQLQMALQTHNITLPATKAQFKALVLETQQRILSVKAQIETIKAKAKIDGEAGIGQLKYLYEVEKFKQLIYTQSANGNIKFIQELEEIKADIIADGGTVTMTSLMNEYKVRHASAQGINDVNNYVIGSNGELIKSQNSAGQASVAYGENVKAGIDAMLGDAHSLAETIKNGGEVTDTQLQAIRDIEITPPEINWDNFHTPEFDALNVELEGLESLYGTLMQNMSSFADFYGDEATSSISDAVDQIDSIISDSGSGLSSIASDVGASVSSAGDAAQSASEKFDDLTKSILQIEKLKAVWGEDDLSAKKIILDATMRITGLTHLNNDNFLEEFTKITADGLGLDQKTLQAYQDMSDAIRGYQAAIDSNAKKEKDAIKKDISFYEGVIKSIQDSYLGSLSSMFAYEKADYAAQQAENYKVEGNQENYLKMLQSQLESERKMSRTKEEYERNLFQYREELRKQNPDNIEEEKLEELKEIKEQLVRVEEAIEDTYYKEVRHAG